MGKGGGSQPSQTTAYQTNLPEYAKPYVENMLGAAQNQLFQTSGDQITGFRPYTPYSTDPTQYFAGPSSLQQSSYNEAGQMQTPGQFNAATGLAGMSGMGQLGTAGQAGMYGQRGAGLGMLGAMQAAPAFGAGQQYANQVTNPNSVAQYMSPYQQQVTDIAKMNAVREAQLAGQQANLGAARQGTYGGARQALAAAEREKNLLSNLSNIQAQGSQAAYDKAMQSQQFGANLGLQGIQTGLQGLQTGMQGIGQGLQGVGAQQAGYAGAGQAASTLGQLGGAQQQADIARLGLQNQFGQQQQGYQQNIINQAIQDYATAQQYPYMQLSTMSNLLRGLPMQGMTTQQYQAQPSTTQQLIGLGGTAAALGRAGIFKEGGSVKGLGYANRGQVDSMRDRLEEMYDTDPEDTAKYVSKSSSPAVKKLALELGIGRAPTGKLGTNMAGGGIIAFEEGGNVPGFYAGELIDGFGTNPEAMAMDQMRLDEAKLKKDLAQYEFLKNASPVAAERFLANNPAVRSSVTPAAAKPNSGFTESSFKDFDQAQALFEKERNGNKPPAAAPVNTDNTNANTSTGLDAIIADRKRRLGFDGEGEKNQAFMKALEERQAGMGKERESDRYLRMAEAFSKFGSTAGPMLGVASEALGGFAKGEAAARKEDDKFKLEGMKMQADLEKARRAEARGDLDAAERFYGSYEDRKNRLEVANIGAAAAGQTANFKKESIERIMKEKGVDFSTALREVEGARGADSLDFQIANKAYAAVQASIGPAGANSKKYKELMKSDPTGAAAQEFANKLVQDQIRGMKAAMGLGGGGGGGNVDSSNPLLKR